ncbi:amino acid adenylation domain-containing protein [Streptomyces verrucosisporus]|uniref:non-ribosomal peptide synthetase n=1 Tax=Streptomyces verrucosisporus TaxID=1695161 RepID=UPI0019D2A8F9|nr:amino acid adenylation domain-containing protein [Streptomyces verrucosisporus]MBN3928792.1 amino acid adenylation domain-containing protein [Streptomyces verrucosisporus]
MPASTSSSALPDPNGRRAPYPRGAATTLHLIEEQARATPDADALYYDGATMSYRELDRRANSLAAMLVDHGARRETLLPLLVSDGMELPLAMVAAMKAGIPFIPFDPGWPRERIGALLRGLGTDIAVVSPRTPAPAAGCARALVADHRKLDGTEAAPAGGRPGRGDLAYGFFTSGTTGLPKCTLNVHRGLLNRFLYMTRRFGTGHVALQNSRSVFDSSLWQLLWPLTMGGSVVMPRRDGLLDLERTVDQIGRHGVTITDFVPSIFTVLVDLLASDPALARAAGSLRHVLLGGEAINVEAVRRFHGLLPGTAITNTYGPTEASIGSVFHTVTADDGSGGEIPVGRPIDNTSAVVADSSMRRLGTGETGEILIGGDCLGLGYLGDPERTGAAFVPNPFPDVPGDRLYRTGDLGHYRADGRLYFVGRRDDQLKVRGVRIEPAEVERALLTLPGVQDVRVVLRGEADGQTLVAAVVAREDLDLADTRARAGKLLPAELVPDRFVRIESMPLSPNGKADRRALARLLDGPDSTERNAAGQAAAPGSGGAGSGPTPGGGPEGAVRSLWAELLGVTPGPRDGFFEIGGTSLSAQRLVLRLRDLFGLRLSVRDIAEAPTVADQVRLIARGGPEAEDAAVHREMLADAAALEPDSPQPASPAAVPPPRSAAVAPPRRILLTGGTGFIGIHLLDELLRSTAATVACLVNAGDDAAARARLDARARHYGLPVGSGDDRVRVVRGDLGAEGFGLSEAGFRELAEWTDTIVHAGAEVNLVYPYRRLRAVNVLGTREVVRLARTGPGPASPVHHLSTLGILPRAPHDGSVLGEDAFPAAGEVPGDGYSRSKWVAEALLREARRRYGLPVSLYRMGEVMPHSRTGVLSHGGSLAEFVLTACAELGVRFETGARGDFTPVDNVGRFISAAVRERRLGETFHVVQREPTRLDDLMEGFGPARDLRHVTYREFRELVAAHSSPSLQRLAMVLPDPDDGPGDLGGLFRDIPSPDFSRNCHRWVRSLDVEWLGTGWAAAGRPGGGGPATG